MTKEELGQFKARVKFTLFAQGISIVMSGEKVLEIIVDLEQAREERDALKAELEAQHKDYLEQKEELLEKIALLELMWDGEGRLRE
jgi:hypothetical protein